MTDNAVTDIVSSAFQDATKQLEDASENFAKVKVEGYTRVLANGKVVHVSGYVREGISGLHAMDDDTLERKAANPRNKVFQLEKRPSPSLARPRPRDASDVRRVGQPIHLFFDDGSRIHGTIAAVHSDNTYDVDTADGGKRLYGVPSHAIENPTIVPPPPKPKKPSRLKRLII